MRSLGIRFRRAPSAATPAMSDPLNFSAIVIKGVHAPVFAYAPVGSQLIRVNTMGLTSADPGHFEYMHRRIPLFPFEMD